jgi:serine protease Do
MEPLVPKDTEIFGVPDTRGVLVTGLLADSPAGSAGMAVEDVLVAVDGERVESREQIRSIIADKGPGETAKLEVLRDGARKEIAVRLGLQPENTRVSDLQGGTIGREVAALGLLARTLRPGLLSGHDENERGVAVVGVRRELADRIQLEDVIVAVDGKPVTSVTQLLKVLAGVRGGEKVRVELLKPTGDREIKTVPTLKG